MNNLNSATVMYLAALCISVLIEASKQSVSVCPGFGWKEEMGHLKTNNKRNKKANTLSHP